jgi:hypothetical protein
MNATPEPAAHGACYWVSLLSDEGRIDTVEFLLGPGERYQFRRDAPRPAIPFKPAAEIIVSCSPQPHVQTILKVASADTRVRGVRRGGILEWGRASPECVIREKSALVESNFISSFENSDGRACKISCPVAGAPHENISF